MHSDPGARFVSETCHLDDCASRSSIPDRYLIAEVDSSSRREPNDHDARIVKGFDHAGTKWRCGTAAETNLEKGFNRGEYHHYEPGEIENRNLLA